MNLLSLISPWLDINCQITMKCTIVPKFKLFRELNTAFVVGNRSSRLLLLFQSIVLSAPIHRRNVHLSVSLRGWFCYFFCICLTNRYQPYPQSAAGNWRSELQLGQAECSQRVPSIPRVDHLALHTSLLEKSESRVPLISRKHQHDLSMSHSHTDRIPHLVHHRCQVIILLTCIKPLFRSSMWTYTLTGQLK